MLNDIEIYLQWLKIIFTGIYIGLNLKSRLLILQIHIILKSSMFDLTRVIPVRLTAFAQGDCAPKVFGNRFLIHCVRSGWPRSLSFLGIDFWLTAFTRMSVFLKFFKEVKFPTAVTLSGRAEGSEVERV